MTWRPLFFLPVLLERSAARPSDLFGGPYSMWFTNAEEYYDAAAHMWYVQPGQISVHLPDTPGASTVSGDRLTAEVLRECESLGISANSPLEGYSRVLMQQNNAEVDIPGIAKKVRASNALVALAAIALFFALWARHLLRDALGDGPRTKGDARWLFSERVCATGQNGVETRIERAIFGALYLVCMLAPAWLSGPLAGSLVVGVYHEEQQVAETTLSLCLTALGDALLGSPFAEALDVDQDAARKIAADRLRARLEQYRHPNVANDQQ